MAVEVVFPTERHPIEAWTHLYRVGFWSQQTPPSNSDVDPEQVSWSVELWDVHAEDVHEVIAWADEQAGEARTYTLYIRLEDRRPGEDMLVQIAGVDPTRNPPFADGFRERHPSSR